MLTTRNISMSVDDVTTAQQLAKDAGLSFSAFIRELIRDRAKASTNDR